MLLIRNWAISLFLLIVIASFVGVTVSQGREVMRLKEGLFVAYQALGQNNTVIASPIANLITPGKVMGATKTFSDTVGGYKVSFSYPDSLTVKVGDNAGTPAVIVATHRLLADNYSFVPTDQAVAVIEPQKLAWLGGDVSVYPDSLDGVAAKKEVSSAGGKGVLVTIEKNGASQRTVEAIVSSSVKDTYLRVTALPNDSALVNSLLDSIIPSLKMEMSN